MAYNRKAVPTKTMVPELFWEMAAGKDEKAIRKLCREYQLTPRLVLAELKRRNRGGQA